MLQVTTCGEMENSNACSYAVACINSNTKPISGQVKHGSVSVSLAASNDSQRTVAYEVTADTIPYDYHTGVQADDRQSACEVDAQLKCSFTGSEQADAGFCSKQSCTMSVSRSIGINSSSKKTMNTCDQNLAVGGGDDSKIHTAIKYIVNPSPGQTNQRKRRQKFKAKKRLMRSQMSHVIAKYGKQKQARKKLKANVVDKNANSKKTSLFSNETFSSELSHQKTSQAVQVTFLINLYCHKQKMFILQIT
jgi:hypothetical protein